MANQLPAWRSLVQGKKVALVLHQSSLVKGRLLVDVMLEEGVSVRSLFVPEHGLRGEADAGAQVTDAVDTATGIPVY
ncbi:MAG: exo-beta-N-acetylmuramidase NamZ domain-containing protein, partial [Bacteroidota bacterium]